MKRFVTTICCIVILCAAASRAPAQEIEEVEKQPGTLPPGREHRPPWEFSFGSTWLPGSAIHGTGGDLSMNEVKGQFTRRFAPAPRVELSTGLDYTARVIDAPDSALLPDSLHALSVNFEGEYRSSDALSLGLRVSPGLSGDFRSVTSDDVRVPVSFHARYRMSKAMTLLGGIAYTGQRHFIPVLPVLGATYSPAESWTLVLGFPRTGVIFRPDRGTELFAGGEFSGGEFRLHNPSIGANVITYRDYRAVAGGQFSLSPLVKVGIAGGYAFARKFAFYEGSRSDVNLDSAPFARLEFKFAWR